MEAYPETRAFMKLLASLTQYPVPANLGAGYRVPGFSPYLEFLRDSVLLKFKARAYLDPNEKVILFVKAFLYKRLLMMRTLRSIHTNNLASISVAILLL